MFYDKGPVVVLVVFITLGIATLSQKDISIFIPTVLFAVPVGVYIHRASEYKKNGS